MEKKKDQAIYVPLVKVTMVREKAFPYAAEENHRLVECFLRRNRLERSEFYDVVIFGYLKAVQEYLEEPRLSKYRFSSIAWIEMKESMINEFSYRNQLKRKAPMGVYHEGYDSELRNKQLSSQMESISEEIDNRQQIWYLTSHMSTKEKEVVYMRAAGYTYREIAEICNITIRGVSARLEKMRRRFRTLALV